MREIPLTQGRVALVDDEDYERVIQHSWCVVRGYVQTSLKNRHIYLHRYIMHAQKGTEVDHRNQNTLDCRKSNLRICTRSQNSMNLAPNKHTSKYKGVCWSVSHQKWHAEITIQQVKKHLGYFNDEVEAARCRDEAAKQYHGEFAFLNFQ